MMSSPITRTSDMYRKEEGLEARDMRRKVVDGGMESGCVT